MVGVSARGCGALLRRFEFRGKWRLASVLGGAFARAGLEHLEAVPAPGTGLRVLARDRVGRLMWAGSYEPELTFLLSRVLCPGWFVFDVGAHIGWFTVLSSSLVGPEGRVAAFEPDPTNFGLLMPIPPTSPTSPCTCWLSGIPQASEPSTAHPEKRNRDGELSWLMRNRERR